MACNCRPEDCWHSADCRKHYAYATPIDNQSPRYLKRCSDYDARGLLTWEGHCRQQYGPGEPNMAQQPIQRTKADRIERLRKRLDDVNDDRNPLVPIIKGLLDLLADEL